jgi:cytidylate kinase
MAKCIPTELPNWVLQEERRSTEIKVYEKCADELSDEWHIFYSRPWWGLNAQGGEKDGEADFVLAHPDLGILFVEVKGGQITYDEKKDQWASTDRHGITHNFRKSPVQQAVACKHELMKKFQKSNKWPSARVLAHHGVVLVDTVDPGVKMIGGFETELFCFAKDFERNFQTWIEGRLKNHRDKNEVGPGKEGIEAIHEVLAKPLKLRTTLSRFSAADMNAMNQLLTGVQLQTLAEIETENRLVVEGGAGTGKTVVACELASRSIDPKYNVALSTVSDALLTDFKIRLGEGNPNLNIMSVNELIEHNSKFDLIIIDESQDVDWSHWARIEEKLLSDESKLVCFMDSNQAIYRIATDLETRLRAKRITMRVNLRNTQKIGKVINNLYSGPLTAVCGPEGMQPKLTVVSDIDRAIINICSEVKKLNEQEVVDYSAIAILSDNKEFTRKLQHSLKAAMIFNSPAKNRALNTLTVDTVFNFKGLEAPFVFIFMDADSGNNRELSYVASSRARTYLHVYGLNENSLVGKAIKGELK